MLKDIDEKYKKKIYWNILKVIVIVFCFIILNATYGNASSIKLGTGTKIITMIFLILSIYFFEKAYKKDSGTLALDGIEILILSSYMLTIEHIINKFDFKFTIYCLITCFIFLIYFVLKIILIYTNARKQEANKYSDIKEIVKKDEPVKKEAKKKIEKEQDKQVRADKVEENIEHLNKKVSIMNSEPIKKNVYKGNTTIEKKKAKHLQEKEGLVSKLRKKIIK